MEELLIPIYVEPKTGLQFVKKGQRSGDIDELGDTIRPLAFASIDQKLKEGFTVKSYQISGTAERNVLGWLVVVHLTKTNTPE